MGPSNFASGHFCDALHFGANWRMPKDFQSLTIIWGEEDAKLMPEIGRQMQNSPIVVRVLVVDDYEPFRCIVRQTLGARPELQVIDEATDGLEAVQKAEELQPDLILFDVGLPKVNGIEAARRIRTVSPESKILFVS